MTTVASVAWSQIPLGVKMSLGARNVARMVDVLSFEVGPGNPKRHITVTLNGRDLYDIECTRSVRGRDTIEAERHDIYAEDLGRTLLGIESEVWG